MKKDKKSNTLAVVDNYNCCDIQTDGHGDSMTDPAQMAELVKSSSICLDCADLPPLTPSQMNIQTQVFLETDFS